MVRFASPGPREGSFAAVRHSANIMTPSLRNRWSFHLALLCLVTAGLSLLFVQEPGVGDDLTYWTFAYDLHDLGLKAWGPQSFHDLRWPVWGVSWVLQGCGIHGISAYTGVAVFYLMAGAAVAFAF